MKTLFSPIKLISFIIFSYFAFAGMLHTSNYIHELSHKEDFKDYAIDGYICMTIIPDTGDPTIGKWLTGRVASYNYRYNASDNESINRIDRYTEHKAYAYSSAIIISFSLMFGILLNQLYGENIRSIFRRKP